MKCSMRTEGRTADVKKANNRFSKFSERARYHGKIQQVSLNVMIDYVLCKSNCRMTQEVMENFFP